jgi:hypothetical protein
MDKVVDVAGNLEGLANTLYWQILSLARFLSVSCSVKDMASKGHHLLCTFHYFRDAADLGYHKGDKYRKCCLYQI